MTHQPRTSNRSRRGVTLGSVTHVPQPRQRAGERRRGVATGGQFTGREVPGVDSDLDDLDSVGVEGEWPRSVVVHGYGEHVVFNTEPVGDDADALVVTTNCEPPDMLLLARKGDAEYWSNGRWWDHPAEVRLWSAEIIRQMLQDGLVSTIDTAAAARDAIHAASSPEYEPWRFTPHVLTGAVAQIRGLRLIQSMAPQSSSWETTFGGHRVENSQHGQDVLLRNRYRGLHDVYAALPQPPWVNGPAGYVTNGHGLDVFVGVNGDLLWRALTETDHHGTSVLKAAMGFRRDVTTEDEMICAAALYDETAQYQLTTGLLDGVDTYRHETTRLRALNVFRYGLNPEDGDSRWTAEQQNRIRGFIETVEGLEL